MYIILVEGPGEGWKQSAITPLVQEGKVLLTQYMWQGYRITNKLH